CMCSTLSFGAAEAAAACCTFLATTAGSGSAACVELGPLIFIEAPLHPITSGGAVSPHQKRRFGRYCNSFRTAPCNWFDCCNADIPVCSRIVRRDMLDTAVGISAARIPSSALVRFCTWLVI